jgi:NADH dehydrogenase [ubiquinone] 1 alpha subcomplex assembly factor 5
MRLNVPRLCRPQNLRSIACAPCGRRTYASQASGGAVFKVFNARTKWLQKERAAANAELGRQADYLKDEVAMRVCERLLVRSRPAPIEHRPVLPADLNPRTSSGTSLACSTSAQTRATSPAP